MYRTISLISGLFFGVGLALSGMTDTNKVLGFLDVLGDWDIALLLVMCGALAVTIPGFYLVTKTKKPLFSKTFSLPSNQLIDKKLISGAVIFGIGWGLYGYCPGPALASLVYGNLDSLFFVLAMLAGMQVNRMVSD